MKIIARTPFVALPPVSACVSPTSLVSFDRNRYSVHTSDVCRTFTVQVYADRPIFVVTPRSWCSILDTLRLG